MKNIFLISVVTVFSTYIVLSCSSKNNSTVSSGTETSKSFRHHNDSMSAGMLQPIGHVMDDMKMTGDFDLDFATTMILHHQAAIDMSKSEVAKGNNEQIKKMAQNIINSQNVEIDQLQLFVKNYQVQQPQTKTTEIHDELNIIMKTMADNMATIEMTGNIDRDFVMLMIPHHESAVKMAEEELIHGKEAILKKMAQQMIADQGSEIGEFKAWLFNQQ